MKIIKTRGNFLLAKKAEHRNKVKMWVGMALVANVCLKIDKKRRMITTRNMLYT